MNILLLSRKKIVALFAILTLLGALPIILYLQSQQQDIRQRAAETDPSVMASFDGQPMITEQDVKTFADQTYQTVPTDTAEMRSSLDELIERKLLEKVIQEENIQIIDQDIMSQLATDDLTDLANDPVVRANAKVNVMKRKIELLFTKTREAYTIGFWLPPTNYGVSLTPSSQELITKQRADTPNALTDILSGIQAGEEPLAVAHNVVAKYPSLTTVMAVNGYILSTTENQKVLTQPLVYSFQKDRENVTFFKILFSLSPGQIALVEDPETSLGGVVIKITGATNGAFDDYPAWLSDQKVKHVVLQ